MLWGSVHLETCIAPHAEQIERRVASPCRDDTQLWREEVRAGARRALELRRGCHVSLSYDNDVRNHELPLDELVGLPLGSLYLRDQRAKVTARTTWLGLPLTALAQAALLVVRCSATGSAGPWSQLRSGKG